ncbi:phosphopantothenoylcysteine decarboxylase [Candidatus Latescibacterota bacterium]
MMNKSTSNTRDWKGRVLVTSGPTRAYIDRIRYIANTSSGVLGARIVESLISRNIAVTHIRGTGSEKPNINNAPFFESVESETIDDVISSIKTAASHGDIEAVVHAMAVLDYVPEKRYEAKKSSGDDYWDIRLVRTPKVISILREVMPEAYIVGFKLEVGVSEEELVRRAGVPLNKYGLDIVVANDLDTVSETHHEAVFVGPGCKIIGRADTKEKIARIITEYVVNSMKTV